MQQALGHDVQSIETETNVPISQDTQTIEAGPGAGRMVSEVIQSFVQVQQVLDKTSARWAIVLLVEFFITVVIAIQPVLYAATHMGADQSAKDAPEAGALHNYAAPNSLPHMHSEQLLFVRCSPLHRNVCFRRLRQQVYSLPEPFLSRSFY
eukprot:SAG22_NODE_1070_length_5723_cov_2.407539_7_plen_151_part_00